MHSRCKVRLAAAVAATMAVAPFHTNIAIAGLFPKRPAATPKAETSKADSLIKQAQQQIEKGDYRGAVRSLSAALKNDAANPLAYELRASAYSNLGRKDDSEADLVRARTIREQAALVVAKDAATAPASTTSKAAPVQAMPVSASKKDPTASDPAAPPATNNSSGAAPRVLEATQAPQPLSPTPPAGQAPAPATPTTTAPSEDFPTLQPAAGTLSGGGSGPTPSPSPSAGNATAPGSTIDASSMSEFGGNAQATARIIDEAPAAAVRQTAPLYQQPVIRGFNAAQLNATANGVNQLKTRLDIDTAFSQIDPGIVRNMTIIDGPYTALWGPGFAFMVADLYSAQTYDRPTGRGSTIFNWDSNGQYLYARQNVSGGSQMYGVYASIGQRVGNDYTSGDGFKVPASFNQWDGFAAGTLNVTRGSRFDYNFIHLEQNNIELPGVFFDIRQNTSDQINVRYVIQEDANSPQRLVVQYWNTQTVYDGNSFAYSKFATTYPLSVLAGFGGVASYNVNGSLRTQGARAISTIGDTDSFQLTIGADWRRYRVDYVETDFFFNGRRPNYGIPRSAQEDYGFLTGLSAPLTEAVIFSAGGRLDFLNSSFDTSSINSPTTSPIGDITGTSTPYQLLHMAYLSGQYSITDNTRLTAGMSTAMRPPQLQELYNNQGFLPIYRNTFNFVNGNSSLVPERNLQFDIGANTSGERASFGVRGFYSHIYNYILPVSDGIISSTNGLAGGNPYTYVNNGDATLAGGDISGRLNVGPWLTILGNTAYVKGVLNNPYFYDTFSNNRYAVGHAVPVPNIYPWNGTLTVRVAEPEQQRYGVDFITRMAFTQLFVASVYGELPSSSWQICDLRGYWKVRDGFRLTSTISNLFNQDYTQAGSLLIFNPATGQPQFVPQRGISFLMGAELNY